MRICQQYQWQMIEEFDVKAEGVGYGMKKNEYCNRKNAKQRLLNREG